MLNASESTDEHFYNTTVDYTCDTGFKFFSDNTTAMSMYCNEDGIWEPENVEVCQSKMTALGAEWRHT